MKNFKLMAILSLLFATTCLVAQPTTAPTTPPVRNATDVISLFSDAYTDVAGTLWFPNWGQSTVVTDEVIAGNNVKKYVNLNYQGVQFQDPIVPINAASMTHLHLDIWTPNCTAFDVFLINTTPATVEHAYTITPTASGWNSIDIPLTAFTSSAPVIALNNIGQFKFVGTPFGSSTVWLDNIYFWKPANVPTITGFTVPAKIVGDPPFTLTAPTSNSSGAFSYTSSNTSVATISGSTVTIVGAGTSTITANQAAAGGFTAGSTTATLVVTSPGPSTAAPTPTVAAANVISLFSNAYTNVGVDTWSAVWDAADVADVTIAGNATKKYTNHLYSGIEFTGANLIDATSKTHIHMDVWTADAAGTDAFKVKLVDFGANGTFDGGDDAASIELPFSPTASGWFAIDVPLSSFTGLTTKAHLAQLVLVTPGGGKTFWLDNVYFYNLPTVVGPTVAAPTPTRAAANVTSLFSNAYTDLAGTNWNPGWGQSTVYSEVMIAGNATKKYETLNYQGAEPAATVNLTSRTHLHFDAWAASAVNFRVKLVDFGANGVFGGGDDTEHELEYTLTGNTWDSKDIPLSSFTGMTAKAHLGQFIISSTTTPSPTVWMDNIYFYNEPVTEPMTAAPTPTRPAANVISLFSNAYTNVAGTDWFPNWGQSTVVTDIQIAGNDTKKYATMNYQGVQFASPVNASSMINLHLDLWTPNCTAFDVYLINTSPGVVEQKVTLTPTLAGWNSFDIALSQYNTINLTNIGQIKLVATPGGTSTVFLDNIYFWTTATPPTISNFTVPAKMVGNPPFTLTAPTSNSPGAFTYSSSNTSVATISGTTVTIVGGGTSIITATQAAAGGYASGSISANLVVSFPAPLIAAPVPTRLPANVISLFSDDYTAVAGTDWFPNWGQSTVVTDFTIDRNETKKYNNLNYQGVQFASPINVSGMNFLHIDLWTPNCTAFDVFLINTSPGTVEQAYTLTPTLNGWNSFDIPLTAYNTIALNNIGQFKFVGTPGGSSVVYLDNIYFWKTPIIPVELTSFKAKAVNNTTVLNWQTASERDNQGFTIERSSNGVNYSAIGQVKGNGTTPVVHDYTFTDNNPSVNINYYRLRQTDFNGKETLSPVVSVLFGKNGLVVKNTVTNDVIDVLVGDATPVTLSIFNVSGQQVYTNKVQGAQSIDVSAFPAGIYFIRTTTGDVSRFVKN